MGFLLIYKYIMASVDMDIDVLGSVNNVLFIDRSNAKVGSHGRQSKK